MEFEFRETYIEVTPFIEWWHASEVRTRQSVKWCLKLINHHF
jgi:hypothetical protein